MRNFVVATLCTSEHTGLPDACADLIIAAQAFHWFHLERTFAEVERIGTPRSACVAFWNVRLEDTPFMQGYETLLRTWSTQYEVNERALLRRSGYAPARHSATAARRREGAAGRTIKAIRERAPHAELRAFMHSVPMDRARVRNLALSSSYVKHGVADIAAFLEALEPVWGLLNEGLRGYFSFRRSRKIIA